MGSKKNKKVKSNELSENHSSHKARIKEDILPPEQEIEIKHQDVSTKKSKKKKYKLQTDNKIKIEPTEYEVKIESEEYKYLDGGSTDDSIFTLEDIKPKKIRTGKKETVIPDDMLELVNRIEKLIPADDILSYRKRAEKLDWNSIVFNGYTVEECKETFNTLQRNIRRFRTLSEIINDAKEYLKNPKIKNSKTLKGKKRQHPEMPLKPPSQYMIFYKRKKNQLLAEKPGIDFGELSHQISLLFKSLPEEKKIKYERLATEARATYKADLEKFYLRHPEIERPVGKLKKEKQPRIIDLKPKKPHTPFNLYVDSQFNKRSDEASVDKNAFREKCKIQWKKMSDKKKMVWINMAEEAVFTYEEEVKAYSDRHPDYVPVPVKHILTKEEVNLKDRLLGKPEKPPTSAFALFHRTQLQTDGVKKIKNLKDRMSYISAQWKNCSEEDRSGYRERASEMLEKYKKDYAHYINSLPEDKRLIELEKSVPKRKLKIDKNNESNRKPKKSKMSGEKLEEPKTPSVSPFKFFTETYNGKIPAIRAWKKLSATEKTYYERELIKLKQTYILEFEKFLNSLSVDELEEYRLSKQSKKKKANSEQEEEEDDDDSDEEGEDDEEDEEEENDEDEDKVEDEEKDEQNDNAGEDKDEEEEAEEEEENEDEEGSSDDDDEEEEEEEDE